MFGIFRLLLSLMVIVTHLGGNDISGWAGSYAVFSFYALSGYLMTLVLSESYGFSFNGLVKFFINRYLRIYPIYYAVMLLAIPIIYFLPEVAQTINVALRIPNSPIEWTHNIFIFGLMNDKSRIIPPAWSLYIELFFYIAIAFFFARNSKITFSWFGISLLYTIFLISTNAPFAQRYYTIPAASLPFSTGATIYFLRKKIQHLNSIKFIYIFGTAFAINVVCTRWLYGPDGWFTFGFYINFFLASLLILALSYQKSYNPIIQMAEKISGNLAYPVFLCHYHIAIIISWITQIKIGLNLVLLSSIFTLLFAYFIHITIGNWINQIREKIKNPSYVPA